MTKIIILLTDWSWINQNCFSGLDLNLHDKDEKGNGEQESHAALVRVLMEKVVWPQQLETVPVISLRYLNHLSPSITMWVGRVLWWKVTCWWLCTKYGLVYSVTDKRYFPLNFHWTPHTHTHTHTGKHTQGHTHSEATPSCTARIRHMTKINSG